MQELRYFPQYYRASRAFARDLPAKLQEVASRDGLAASEHYLVDAVGKDAMRTGASVADLMEGTALSQEMAAAQTYAQFMLDGAFVYDVAPKLGQALHASDTDELCISQLHLPAHSFYLHFGRSDIRLNDAWPLEGLFVLPSPRSWRLILCARRTAGPGSWFNRPGETHLLRIPPECFNMPFPEAVASALKIDAQDIEMARARISRHPQEGLLPPSLKGVADTALELNELNQTALRDALVWAGNALAYLTAYPEDARRDWQPGSPASMVEKANRPGKEGERAASKMTSMGFWNATVVGAAFDLASGDAAGSSVSAHWRRGHWRHQAHGPAMSLRKLVWIRPMRVLGGAVAEHERVLREQDSTGAPPPPSAGR